MTARNAFGAKGGATLGRNGLEQTGAVVGEAIAQGGTEAAINTGTAAGTAVGEATFEAVQALQDPATYGAPDFYEEGQDG